MDKAYIAGYMDGEGCFAATKRKDESYKRGYDIFANVSVSSVSSIVLKEIQSIYGGSICTKQRNKRHKPLMVLTLASKACVTLINDILPHLKLKHEQASLILELQSTRAYGNHNKGAILDRRDEIRARIKTLNKRGIEVVDTKS